ncbi:MAG: phosphodiesterase, partial [Candidatus Latescibacterota bacterium]
IRDVAPTVLASLNIPIPTDMQGHSALGTTASSETAHTSSNTTTDDVYTEDEKKALEDRLKSLGYL